MLTPGSDSMMSLFLAFADATHGASDAHAAAGGDHAWLRGYLIGWLFWLGISLGGAALTWLHHLTGGKWGKAIRLELTAAGQTLPLVAIGVIPILLNLPALYEWARPEVVSHDALLQKKAGWLNSTFFVVRAVCYCVAWIGMTAWVTRLRRRAQASPTFENEHALRFYGAAGILVYGLTVTLASIDFSMSLEPHWYSGIYGVVYMISQALAALGFAASVASLRKPQDDPAPFVSRDLGNLMLAFTMLWTYVSLSQFLIIWMGDLPEENVWYLHRLERGWRWLAMALVSLAYFVPFFALLSSEVKTSRRLIGFVGFWVVLMRWFDIVWHVEPAFAHFNAGTLSTHAMIAAGMGVVWLPVFIWRRNALRSDFPYEAPIAVEGH